MKRHQSQNNKQKLGQYYTTQAITLLDKYIPYFKGKDVIDPFAGNCDLLDLAKEHDCSVLGYDLDPIRAETIRRNTLLDPPDFTKKFLLTNPPYLCSNKNKDKTVYEKWKQNDLYKCHIASFVGQAKEGILIVPSNFLSESSSRCRSLFFSKYKILECDYYYYPVFKDATTGVCIFYFQESTDNKSFPCRIHYNPNNIIETDCLLCPEYNWLTGKEFFDFINVEEPGFKRWTGKESGFLTSMIVGLLDYGKHKQGLSYNRGNPIICKEKAFTTYQLVSPFKMSKTLQKDIVEIFNTKMEYFRDKYHGMFLSNYMGANQKIYSRSYIHRLINRIHFDLTSEK